MKTIKEDLKTLAQIIKHLKSDIVKDQRSNKYTGRMQSDLVYKSCKFRCNHIAYCMLRGRKYEEIENKTASDNSVNMSKIESVMKTMTADIAIRRENRYRLTLNNDAIYKMYCIVRTDMDAGYTACQCGHAIAQYFIDHGMHEKWDNGTMIYLKADNEKHLMKLRTVLEKEGIKYSYFIEPDIGNECTAISYIDNGDIFKELNLL